MTSTESGRMSAEQPSNWFQNSLRHPRHSKDRFIACPWYTQKLTCSLSIFSLVLNIVKVLLFHVECLSGCLSERLVDNHIFFEILFCLLYSG